MSAKEIPYSRQWIEPEDLEAVTRVLTSDLLTTGPMVERFESALSKYVGSRWAVAFSSGTTALYSLLKCVGLGPGDEVIVPSFTFVATASAVVHTGATPIFADVDPGTLLLDPSSVQDRITVRTKAMIAVDYAGQPCRYDELRSIAERHGLLLIADACHSLGAKYRGRRVGAVADATVFSFHPVKPVTTGEGGAVTTNDGLLQERLRRIRNHGIDREYSRRTLEENFAYDVLEAGWNFRITDFQCALGLSQLQRCEIGLQRRNAVATFYRQALQHLDLFRPLVCRSEVVHAYHLFVVRISPEANGPTRSQVIDVLAHQGVRTNVHYPPVHLFTFFRERYGTKPGLCPQAEQAYQEVLSLPIFAAMTSGEACRVMEALGCSMAGRHRPQESTTFVTETGCRGALNEALKAARQGGNELSESLELHDRRE